MDPIPSITWRGTLPASALLTIRNRNGPVDVRPAAGNQAEVRAEKRTLRGGGSIQDVAFEVQTGSNGDVTICSTFRNNNPCDDRSNRGDDDDRGYRRNVTVAITVLVPRGAQLKVSTGNGAASVERVGGDVQASTGNGRVHIDGTAGSVRVSTGNGDVDVRGAKSSVRVSTGNGSVIVSTSEGPVEARSGNGDIDVTMSALRAREDMTFSTGSGGRARHAGRRCRTSGRGTPDSFRRAPSAFCRACRRFEPSQAASRPSGTQIGRLFIAPTHW